LSGLAGVAKNPDKLRPGLQQVRQRLAVEHFKESIYRATD
jgi:hypothetical protein